MSLLTGRTTAPALTAAWGVVLIGLFLLNRRYDLPHLPEWLPALARELAGSSPVGAAGLAQSAGGLGIAILIVVAWWGLGSLVLLLTVPDARIGSRALDWGARGLLGSAAWSTIWLLLGTAKLYRTSVAMATVGVGAALAIWAWSHGEWRSAAEGRRHRTAVIVTAIFLGLALVAALAPPTAKDTLLYHLALPKAYLAAGGLVEVPYNIAGYYALGVEMHAVWAMLLGRPGGQRVSEAAAGATLFAFAPLLLLVVYGWAREHRLDRCWSSLAALMIAAIPSASLVAASHSVDLALAGYTALAVFAAGRWWTTLEPRWLLLLAAGVGAALTTKLSAAVFVLPLMVLLLLRGLTLEEARGDGRGLSALRVVTMGLSAIALGAVLASPWYIRNWVWTGSPLFPFYPTLWPGQAPGWDAERAQLYESLFQVYGRSSSLFDYLLAPLYVSVSAQPELPSDYDGVLGVAYLLGTPIVLWASRRRLLDVELRLASLVSAAMFAIWLLGSQQLRYLLPATPALAVAITAASAAAAAEWGASAGRLLRGLLLGVAAANGLVVVAWFVELQPLRVVLGGEPRAQYLVRRLDYYPYYHIINRDLPRDARVWLINTRRDTYNLERPYFADFIFEDYTLKQWVREARDAEELRAQARAAGITHILVRHDILFDYSRSTIVDDSLPREENQARLERMAALFRQGTRLLAGDRKFWLIELPPA